MNSVAIKIGLIEITWYSIFILSGVIIGYILICKEAKKLNLDEKFINDSIFWGVILGILGARIYYVLFNLDYYSKNLIDIFKVWEGGLAIHGGIIVGIIFTIYFSKKHKLNFWQICDIFCVSLILGQAIGRWGNFMNGEAYGPATTYSTLHNLNIPEFIIKGMKINGVYHHPTFLYESLWNVVGFVLLILLRRILKKTNKYNYGTLTSFYLIWYGIGRFFIEGMRQDSLMIGTFRMAQIVSIFSIIAGISIMLFVNIKKRVQS